MQSEILSEKPRIEIVNADCLEYMKTIKDGSIDLVLTDPPYGTTQCSWDIVCNFEKLWQELKRVCKGMFVMTASQPFTTDLINSNREDFKYCWVWDKGLAGNIFLAEYQPMKVTEDVCIFGNGKYNPIKVKGNPRRMINNGMKESAFGDFKEYKGDISSERNPVNLIYFPNTNRKDIKHPTEKPLKLFQYLLQTYSDKSNTILDPFMGSGTTLVAAKELGRNAIGIEIDPKYYEIAKRRINQSTTEFF